MNSLKFERKLFKNNTNQFAIINFITFEIYGLMIHETAELKPNCDCSLIDDDDD